MNRLLTLFILIGGALLAPIHHVQAQAPAAAPAGQTQTVRGRVLDVATQQPLPGAQVRVAGLPLGAVSDADGRFSVANVPVGRQLVQVTYIGYEAASIPNVLVTSGKEVQLLVELQEAVIQQAEVVITAKGDDPQAPVNEFITLSSRAFNAEETGRFAGSRNDPARMAANFAGVSGANDARNDIIIRGNSPLGLLWRLEGVDIPNPNHYATTGNTGGPVSMLNINLLEKSDFLTGAFPAQYGNALAGVFDLRMRNGNSETHEFLGQVGFNGFEFGAEGPISREAQSSYLVNVRQSNLQAFDAVGIPIGTGSAIPDYRDAAFKLNFPLTRFGAISLWGMAGQSRIDLKDSETDADADEEALYGNGGFDQLVRTGTYVVGLNHRYFFTPRTTGTLSVSLSREWNTFQNDSLDLNRRYVRNYEMIDYELNRASIYYRLAFKVNARHNLLFSVSGDRLGLVYTDSVFRRDLGRYNVRRDVDEANWLLRASAQWSWRATDKLTVNTGLAAQQWTLNDDEIAIEPRVGLRYQATPGTAFTLASGLHHQMQPQWAYYADFRQPDGTLNTSNRDLEFTRSLHFVAGWEQRLGDNTRLKLEAYLQDIDNAPVSRSLGSYSLLNAGAGFGAEDRGGILFNGGTGRNYGMELTLERTFNNGWYYLFTTSLFRSLYEGADGIERRTAFDGGFVVNALAGKEWKVGRKSVFVVDGKFTTLGGRRYTPVDFAASAAAGYEIRDESRAWEEQLNDYLRLDVKLGMRWNNPKVTHEFSIDLQNITGQRNPFTQQYDRLRNQLIVTNQIGFLPIPQYRITF